MARDLFSKLLAAGLSAGVFLIWWPEHHPTTGLMSLAVRGALWTLLYELLLVSFVPLERMARRAVAPRLPERRLPRLPAPPRLGGAGPPPRPAPALPPPPPPRR